MANDTSNGSLKFTVSHRGQTYSITESPETTLTSLQARLEELTSVPPPQQKLLYKGKKASSASPSEVTLSAAGIKDGTRIQMLGSTADEIGGLHAVENEQRRKDKIMRERALKAPAKVRSTGSASSSSLQYRFHRLEPLQHLPKPAEALSLLTRLSTDPAIQHIMQKHHFSVGLLTELAPHEQPHLLGLNVNAGQAIKLRLRTDRYDGFRTYNEVRRVLCHELTHNVWGDHDDNFKELNSKLNREVAEFEQDRRDGTHTLSGITDAFQPSSELEAEAQTYVLGGASSSVPTLHESPEDRRQRILNATMARLHKEDEELEQSCGTAGPASHS
ncbi:WLM-domain-containing protein [Punctularia strigosozonata HHB-11173 SS5]|uniref:WLM-domain-containing protein n=1 Tax=Punctularia strigosozonata (strain HHB-11173) TaxID=741275 RepID=UPI0004418581|nr:WLM-domain-containing protein [Punctularia strigosozonata HHB-11173 SS5]EIN05891.1 WLM-domain-containing protein [Punctularia strigosozonata HHB-11173 SS5]